MISDQQIPAYEGRERVLLVVDTQADFMLPGGKLYVPGAEELIPKMLNYLLTTRPYRSAFVTMDTHLASKYGDTEESKLYPIHCEKWRRGWSLVVPKLVITRACAVEATVQEKGQFDMWADPDASCWSERTEYGPVNKWWDDQKLAHARRYGSSKLVVDVMGVAADVCVLHAVRGLLERGMNVRVLPGLTAGIKRSWEEVAASGELDGLPGVLVDE